MENINCQNFQISRLLSEVRHLFIYVPFHREDKGTVFSLRNVGIDTFNISKWRCRYSGGSGRPRKLFEGSRDLCCGHWRGVFGISSMGADDNVEKLQLAYEHHAPITSLMECKNVECRNFLEVYGDAWMNGDFGLPHSWKYNNVKGE